MVAKSLGRWWYDLLYYWYKRIECTTAAVTTNEIGKNDTLSITVCAPELLCLFAIRPLTSLSPSPFVLLPSKYGEKFLISFICFACHFICAINITRRRYFYLMFLCDRLHTLRTVWNSVWQTTHSIESDWMRKYCASLKISALFQYKSFVMSFTSKHLKCNWMGVCVEIKRRLLFDCYYDAWCTTCKCNMFHLSNFLLAICVVVVIFVSLSVSSSLCLFLRMQFLWCDSLWAIAIFIQRMMHFTR